MGKGFADIPPEMQEPLGMLYQGIKQMAVELVMQCHDADYETTLSNVRQCISKFEEEAFQLRLFEYEGPRTKAVRPAV